MPQQTNSKKWYSLSKGKDDLTIYIDGEIGQSGVTASALRDEIWEVLSENKNIVSGTMYINSYGGEVFEGFSICNEIGRLPIPVDVIANPIAASIASAMAVSGRKLSMYKTTSFLMIHNPWGCTVGDANTHEKSASILRMLEEKAIDIYAKKSKVLSRDEIRDLMKDETWIDAETAVLYGFADEIIDDSSNEAAPKNLSEIKAVAKMELSADKYKMLFDTHSAGKSGKQGVSMIKCKKCAKDIAESSAHCSHCGWNQSIDPLQQASDREKEELKMAVAKAERDRISEISAKCDAFSLPADFKASLIESGVKLEDVAAKILDKVGEMKQVVHNVHITKDGGDSFRQHAANSLFVASGRCKDQATINDVRKGAPINGLHSLMQHELRNKGIDTIGMDGQRLYSEIIKMAATGTSDLPSVLSNTGNKIAAQSFIEAPTTLNLWASKRSANDFKEVSFVKMSSVGDLKTIPEGAGFEQTRLSDKKEVATVGTKGVAWTATRQAFVNDDLGLLTAVPALIGQSAARQVNYDGYNALVGTALAGPTLTEDGSAMFQASATRNNNLIASSGVPTVALISAAEQVLMTMPMLTPEKTARVQYSNVPARYLVTGTANKTVTEQLLKTPYDNAKSIAGVYNPYTGIIPIYDATLGALLSAQSKPYAWYLVADPAMIGSLVVVTLRGQETPTVESAPSAIGEALGIRHHIYFDYVIGFEDWRGMVVSDGD